MFAGRSLAYDQLLAETASEVDVVLDERKERDARLLRRARKQVRDAQVRVAVVAESRAAGDLERELADLLGPPVYHPEHPDHPENLQEGL
jgi:hypothetical protein